MGAESADVYILRPDEDASEDDEPWVNPRPASDVVRQELEERVDIDEDDFDDLSAYVDLDDIAAVVDTNTDEESVTFDVNDHEVTVHESGAVAVGESTD
jgi:hypothetical protein